MKHLNILLNGLKALASDLFCTLLTVLFVILTLSPLIISVYTDNLNWLWLLSVHFLVILYGRGIQE